MTLRKLLLIIPVLVAVFLVAPRLHRFSAFAQSTPVLTSSVASGQPVGTSILWTATPGANWVYRFSVADSSGVFSINQDFSTINTYAWTPIIEGTYTVKVVAQPPAPAAAFGLTQVFTINSLISGTTAVVSPTAHPLVALYSAPPCANGSSIHVEFGAVGSPGMPGRRPTPGRASRVRA